MVWQSCQSRAWRILFACAPRNVRSRTGGESLGFGALPVRFPMPHQSAVYLAATAAVEAPSCDGNKNEAMDLERRAAKRPTTGLVQVTCPEKGGYV